MTEEAYKRAIKIQEERKELESQLASLVLKKDTSDIHAKLVATITKKLYELGIEFAKL
jgi:ATP-dependent Zn protease